MINPALKSAIRNDQFAEKRTPLRFITATSLFDGHDAAINIMRRILQSLGAEVIHLGHNRSAEEIVTAAVHEDVQGIAVSSYQGGHMEFYKYVIDLLKENEASSIRVFGGGGGVILASEIHQLQSYGVTRIYSPEDSQRLGLRGMISDLMHHCTENQSTDYRKIDNLFKDEWHTLARLLSKIETGGLSSADRQRIFTKAQSRKDAAPILGITGTGGSGKSSVIDELIRHFRLDYNDTLKIAVLAVDPTRIKTGGALLGDRIRMNSIDSPAIFMRSMATRDTLTEIPTALPEIIAATLAYDFDLVIVETPGIGQKDAGIAPLVDANLYVMTPEFGAGTQLEKIDMLDFADLVAINKFDQRNGEDALRSVQKQVQRNREAFSTPVKDMPVYGTIASQMNDDGMTALYQGIHALLSKQGLKPLPARIPPIFAISRCKKADIVPLSRQGYLAEIADTIRTYRRWVGEQCVIARELQRFQATRNRLSDRDSIALDTLIDEQRHKLDPEYKQLLEKWPETVARYSNKQIKTRYRGEDINLSLRYTSLSGLNIPKIALPGFHDHGDILNWLLLENLPGLFPFTAGVFAFKQGSEQPIRMFAGEGDPFRTNRRFKYLSAYSDAKRLSTAFDSATLYGFDPDRRPDIFGRIGNSGVSVATLDDMKALYDGFDLADRKTSVSLTINGPAAIILAMFFNTAIDQQIALFEKENSRIPSQKEHKAIKTNVLRTIRGTVQADILKEDQGQNTCIFSTEFGLKLMGDVQEYFIANTIRHFYSASVSGYHIAEAGANPVTQLAFTLANGFTYVEAYLARGMAIDDFAPNLSFFFSNGMDPEYTVIGRVARRVWAIAMRQLYGADLRSQKLKYHIQTSGRSLHSRALDFNDIRTTLQALIALYDNCNSLHTNASDEAVTTPSEESVRKAMAIQMIIDQEWGLSKNENPNQGAFIIEQLTDLVEEAVLQEFDRLSRRGGVLGGMETGYQRNKIQEESMNYEAKKHDGSLRIVGINLFQNPQADNTSKVKLARSSDDEKSNQIKRLNEFKHRNRQHSDHALNQLKQAVLNNENIFTQLIETVRICSLGQITNTLFEVGGKYRRNM